MENFKYYFEKLCQEHELIGANILISNEKEIISKLSYGYSDIDSKTAMDNNTIFRIASVSKVIIALGIMKLVEGKKISLDDDISDILGFTIRNPKYPNIPITIRMVTTQTSSILDGPDDEADDIPLLGYNGVNGQGVDCTLRDLLFDKTSKYYTNLTFGDYKPGEKWNYSNFGCGILACIIEKITNVYYVDYINEILFKPLDIDASFRVGYIKNKESIGSLYSPNLRCRNGEHFLKYQSKIQPLGENYRGPAGGCFINNIDLSKILRMLLNKGTYNGIKLFSNETIELMYQQAWYGNSNDNYSAKSIQMRIYENLGDPILRGHTGGAYGVHSFMFFTLKHKLGMCFVCNGTYDKGFMKKRENLFYLLQKYVYERLCKNKKIDITCDIDNNYFALEERKIILDNPIVIDNEKVFIPINNISDALEIVPIVKDGKIYLSDFIPNITILNNDKYVELQEITDKLNLKFEFINNKIKIIS